MEDPPHDTIGNGNPVVGQAPLETPTFKHKWVAKCTPIPAMTIRVNGSR
jgi:hypothetical protein